jgi:DNA-binding GntR family transcriptional regulator
MTLQAETELELLEEDAAAARLGRMSNRVFDAVKQAIVQLKFRPGNLLSEADVARQLGVSRQPVREAFIKLAEIGLVDVKPQRGTYVKLISIRQVQNVRFIREAIEVAVVRKAAHEATPARIEEFRQILEQQREAEQRGDNVDFLRLDEAFHQALAHSVGTDYAWRVLENLKAQMDRVRYLSMPDATPLDVLVGQHAAITDAVARHAADEAEETMRTHLSEILTSLPRLAQAHPELFTD